MSSVCPRVRLCVPCVSRLPPVSFYPVSRWVGLVLRLVCEVLVSVSCVSRLTPVSFYRYGYKTKPSGRRDTASVGRMMVALGAETAPAIKDFTGAAISFFNNHRVPAALLAASSIKDAFVLQGRGSKLPEDDARAWRLVRYAYLLLMITSFGMEMCARKL